MNGAGREISRNVTNKDSEHLKEKR